nr:hypothetical protein [Tanacetum cinerariifolium]
MGGFSSQRRTDSPMSLIHAFPIDDMYTPEFSYSFQQNNGSFQETAREDSPVEVATLPPKTKSKPTRGCQRKTIQCDDAPDKLHGQTRNKLRLRSSNVRYGEWEMEEGAPSRGLVYEAEAGTTFKLRHGWEILKGSPKWMQKSGEASINQNADVGDDEEDEVQEIRRPVGRDKAKDAAQNKGSGASGSSSMNDEAFS